MFLFDQSSGHCVHADDALVAHRMNVSDGGKLPFSRGMENPKSYSY